jgi:hypothetical protein
VVILAKEFLCTVNGETFSTKEEALNYLMNQFVEEHIIEENESLLGLKKQIELALPGFIADVQTLIENNEEQILVDLSHPDISDTYLQFTIGNSTSYGYHDPSSFSTLEDALSFYSLFLSGTECFRGAVQTVLKQNLLMPLVCKIESIHQSSGTADSFYTYNINCYKEDGTLYRYCSIELDKYDFSSNETLQREIDSAIRKIEGEFLSSLEGIVTKASPKYINDHSFWYEIDGVPINTLLKKNKKVRVEIIEEKGENINE